VDLGSGRRACLTHTSHGRTGGGRRRSEPGDRGVPSPGVPRGGPARNGRARRVLGLSRKRWGLFAFVVPALVVYLLRVIAPSLQSVQDRKSTRLNSGHVSISFAVFSLKKKMTR